MERQPGSGRGLSGAASRRIIDSVDIADTLDATFDGDADVLIPNLDRQRDSTLSTDRVELLKRRRIIAMAPGADWLCDQLDEIEFRGGSLTGDMTMVVADSALWGKRRRNPFARSKRFNRFRRKRGPRRRRGAISRVASRTTVQASTTSWYPNGTRTAPSSYARRASSSRVSRHTPTSGPHRTVR